MWKMCSGNEVAVGQGWQCARWVWRRGGSIYGLTGRQGMETAERVTVAVWLGNGVGKLQMIWTPQGVQQKAQKDGEQTREPLMVGSSCKWWNVADVGHICCRGLVVSSQSWSQAWRTRERLMSAIGDKGNKREMRRGRNGTGLNEWGGIHCLSMYMGMAYILWVLRHPCGTYKSRLWLCDTRWTQNSEFILVQRSTVDGSGHSCGWVSALIPTRMGFSCYNGLVHQTGTLFRW